MSIGRWVGVLIVVSAVAACGGGGSGTSTSASASTASKRTAHSSTGRATSAGAARSRFSTGATGSALAALAVLPVKGRAPKTGYSREQFGDGWLDGRRLRHARPDAAPRPHRQGLRRGDDCAVAERAPQRSVHRGGDHASCAAARPRWTSTTWSRSATPGRRAPSGGRARRRVAFANDPLNLLVGRRAAPTGQKGDGDAATWLPPNKRSAATTSPGRSRSSASTRRGSPRPSTTRSAGCSPPARASASRPMDAFASA